jgi:hypothetical protein
VLGMAKAVLIMDNPEDCTMCKFWNSKDDECYATGVEELSLNSEEAKPDWCPLRELPEKKETHTVLELHSNGRWSEGMKAGFNICLGEILKERKE